ncbi:uncharacterized protein ACDP82_002500 [Pangshura tecta]
MAEDYADGEEYDEEADEDDLAESTQHSISPNSQELFLTQMELPSQPSQATIPDNEAMEVTTAANFSSIPTPSRRLSQIRRWKKKMREEMFSENMEVTRNEKAHLNEWNDVVAKYRKDASDREDRRDQCEDRRDEREDRRDARDERRDARDERWWHEDQRWRDTTLGLLRDQTDVLRHLVELQERQQDHRVLLQPLYNHPHPSPCSTSSSPRRVRTCRGRLHAPAHSTPVDSPTKRLTLLLTNMPQPLMELPFLEVRKQHKLHAPSDNTTNKSGDPLLVQEESKPWACYVNIQEQSPDIQLSDLCTFWSPVQPCVRTESKLN